MALVIKRPGLDQFMPGGKARVRLLVIGGPGVGKTRWASYFPSPIYADCEDGAASIADRGADVAFVTINNSKDMLDFLEMLKQESLKPDDKRRFQTVVIDTIDTFQRKLKDEWLQKNPGAGSFTGRDAWNYIDSKMQMLLTRLLNLDLNVIVNVHYTTKVDNETQQKTTGLQLDGGVKEKIFNDFSLVGWIDTGWQAEGGKRVEKRTISFERTPQREMLKDRLNISPVGGFPINFEPRDYEQLFDKIKERMAELSATQDLGIVPDYEDPASVPGVGVVVPEAAGSGALPPQVARDVPLEQFDKPTLMKMARDEGVEGIRSNWVKTDLLAAIKARREATGTTPEVSPPTSNVVVVEPEAQPDNEPDRASEAPTTVTTDDGAVADATTGEVLAGVHGDDVQEQAIQLVEDNLGGEVISDTDTADEPASPAKLSLVPNAPAATPAANGFPEECGDCGKPLKGEPENFIRLAKIKYKVYACEECYLHRKTHNGAAREA